MFRYLLKGADKETGKDVSLDVEAPDAEMAMKMAMQKRMVVSDIIPYANPVMLNTMRTKDENKKYQSTASESFYLIGWSFRVFGLLFFFWALVISFKEDPSTSYFTTSPQELATKTAIHSENNQWQILWFATFLSSFPLVGYSKALEERTDKSSN